MTFCIEFCFMLFSVKCDFILLVKRYRHTERCEHEIV